VILRTTFEHGITNLVCSRCIAWSLGLLRISGISILLMVTAEVFDAFSSMDVVMTDYTNYNSPCSCSLTSLLMCSSHDFSYKPLHIPFFHSSFIILCSPSQQKFICEHMSCSLLKNDESETHVLEFLRMSYYTIFTFSNVFQKPMQGLSCARSALHFSKTLHPRLMVQKILGISI
jgi:hypothetical protein